MLEYEDGWTPDWQRLKGLHWSKYKYLERDKFEELIDLMMEAHPDHPLTEWLCRGFCLNDGDATIHVGSLDGHKTLQWHLNTFDQEDDEFYEEWFGDDDEEDVEWDE